MSIKKQKERAKRDGWTDWIRSEQDLAAMKEGCYFDTQTADLMVEFFENYLHHTMGHNAGEKFTLLPWQKDVLLPLFSWKRADGSMRFKKGWIWTAKKQGKSTVSAGVCLYYLLVAGKRAEIYGVAHTRDQAGIIYREASAMVKASKVIGSKLRVLDSKKRILYTQNGSFYQVLAGEANARGIEGINPNLILFDEIHAQRSRLLYDGLAYASAARKNSLMLSVSTVGIADPTLIWWEAYEYTQKLLDGSITDPFTFGYLRQADEICADDFDACGDVEQWKKAMPSLGVTVTEETVRQHWIEAKNSPAKQNAFRRYLLNIPTTTTDRVVPMALWNECERDLPDLVGRECFGGLDLASHEDLSAFVLYFPPTDRDPDAFVLPFFFTPRDKINEREQSGFHHYQMWIDNGWLLEAGQARVDHRTIQQVIRESLDIYNVVEIGFDPWGADAVVNELIDEGVPAVAVSQGLKGMTPGTRALLDDISEKRIFHDGNEVLTWCLSNCAADDKNDGMIRFNRQKSADKIDGAVALAMARGRALSVQESQAVPDIFF